MPSSSPTSLGDNDGAPLVGCDPRPKEQADLDFECTTSLATDPKVMDALRDLDGMWKTADPSGHTSVVTDPRQLEALKQMDDLWRDGQEKQRRKTNNRPKVSKYYSDRVEDDEGVHGSKSDSDDDDDDDDDDDANGTQSNGGQHLRESIWTKQSSSSATGSNGDDDAEDGSSSDDEAPLVGGNEKRQKANETKSLGIGGGTALLAMAFADAVDEEEERTSGRPRTSRRSHERKDDAGNAATTMPRINPLALIGGGIIKRNNSAIDDEGASAPLSRNMDRRGGDDDDNNSDEEKRQHAVSTNGNRGPARGAPWARNKSEAKMEGIGSEDSEQRKRNARRLFFRNVEDLERSEKLTLERMDIAGEDGEDGKKPFWDTKVGKIAKGILVPDMYGDEAIEEIEGDQSNRRKGKYGHLSTDEDDEKIGASNDKRNRSRKIESMGYDDDNKALEETLRDQIRMLGGQVMDLETKLMEKTDEVSTLSARVEELESKLAEYEDAESSQTEEEAETSSNLIEFNS